MICNLSNTKGKGAVMLPLSWRESVLLLTVTILVISVVELLQPVDAATVCKSCDTTKPPQPQSSDIHIPPHSLTYAAALKSRNTTSTTPHDYWARFGGRNKKGRDNAEKKIKEALTSLSSQGEKPFTHCQKSSTPHPQDDYNPPEDDLMLAEVYEKIIVHLAHNASILTDPSNLRSRIYRRKAAASLFKELSAEMGDLPEDNDGMWVIKTSNGSSPQTLDVTVKERSRVRLVCNVTGVPDYWVEWRRWSNLTFPGGEEVVGGRSVLFDQVGREDAGNYQCTAKTSDGHIHSANLHLYVNFMPEVFIWARGGGAEGEVELGCLAQGYPQPQLAWYINNTRIDNTVCPSGLRVSVGHRFLAPEWSFLLLRLQGLTTSAHGYYHCSAANSEARAQATLMLHQGDMSLQPVADLAIQRDLMLLKEEMKATMKSNMSIFVMGMVPPMYIAFYIIVYLGCYKSQSIVGAASGRYGGQVQDDGEIIGKAPF